LINIKWSVIAGIFGLVMSFLVGLISGAGFPMVLIRAFIFGASFFLLAAALWFLVNNFVPELLESGPSLGGSGGAGENPGSRVDISLGDEPGSALPDLYRDSGGDEVGNIADLISGKTGQVNGSGMDQNREDGYTQNDGKAAFQPESRGVPPGSTTGDFAGGDFDPADALPDLDVMEGSFRPAGAEPAGFGAESTPLDRSPIGNKTQNLQGDFHPKELAAAIRTKISKE
jgi:hypothetical protein